MRISDWSSDVCSSDLNRHCLSVFHKVFEVPFLLASQVHLIAKRARPALLEIGSPCRMLIRWCRRAAHWALRPVEEKAKEPLYLSVALWDRGMFQHKQNIRLPVLKSAASSMSHPEPATRDELQNHSI